MPCSCGSHRFLMKSSVEMTLRKTIVLVVAAWGWLSACLLGSVPAYGQTMWLVDADAPGPAAPLIRHPRTFLSSFVHDQSAGWPMSFGHGGRDDIRSGEPPDDHRLPHLQRRWATRPGRPIDPPSTNISFVVCTRPIVPIRQVSLFSTGGRKCQVKQFSS